MKLAFATGAVASVVALAVACGGARIPESTTAARVQDQRWGSVVVGGAMEHETAGTMTMRAEGDAGGVALSADASVASAETAWLLAHIAEPPSPMHGTDTDNVRTLAARGPDGVRAVEQVLRHGDSERVPYARRVIERVVLRACRREPREQAQRLLQWLEMGRVMEEAVNDAGILVWTRADDTVWPRAAIARLDAWAGAGAPCGSVRLPVAVEASDADAGAVSADGAGPGAGARNAGAMDAGGAGG